MRKFIDNIVTFFLSIMIIIISIGTVYFCLDVFGIIEVPQEYSIASLFYSQIEVIANNGEILTEDTFPIKKLRKNREDSTNAQQVVVKDVRDPIEVMEEIKEREKEQERENFINVENYYYEQLDYYGRFIYEGLYNNLDKLKTGTFTINYDKAFNDLLNEENGEDTLKNSFQLAINALTFDNPDLFYIDVTKMYLLMEKTTRAFSKTYKVSIGAGEEGSYLSEQFSSEEAVNDAINSIEQIKNEIVSSCEDQSTKNKIKVVHDYLVDSIDYNSADGSNVYNVYGALINKRAVCEGYARACKYILDDLEIPCIIACGVGENRAGETESHAWNYVMLDGKWYALDVTWDDPVVPENFRVSDESRYSYFLKGSDEFFKDHLEDGNIVGEAGFKYPSLSESDYNR